MKERLKNELTYSHNFLAYTTHTVYTCTFTLSVKNVTHLLPNVILQAPYQTLKQTRHRPSNRMRHALITKTAFKVNWYMNTSVQATQEHEHEIARPSLRTNQTTSQLKTERNNCDQPTNKEQVSRQQPAHQPELAPQNFSIFSSLLFFINFSLIQTLFTPLFLHHPRIRKNDDQPQRPSNMYRDPRSTNTKPNVNQA